MKKNFQIISIFFLLSFTINPFFVHSAEKTLYMDPSAGSYKIGEEFDVDVRVESDGLEINVAEAEISYDVSELNVVKLNTDNSPFDLWTSKPSFSNETGIITFAGGTRDSFVGTGESLITITFVALKSLVSKANLTAGAILAADGTGSNIITGIKSGAYKISPKALSADVFASEAVEILSSTHANENTWYSNSKVSFNWKLDANVSAVRLLIDDKTDSTPTVLYKPAISDKTISNMDDGVWYFHMQTNSNGVWNNTAHKMIRIDTTAPSILNFSKNEQTGNAQYSFNILAEDSLSGVDFIEITINDTKPIIWHDDGSHIFTTPQQTAGAHTINIKTVDKAGNSISESSDFVIDGELQSTHAMAGEQNDDDSDTGTIEQTSLVSFVLSLKRVLFILLPAVVILVGLGFLMGYLWFKIEHWYNKAK